MARRRSGSQRMRSVQRDSRSIANDEFSLLRPLNLVEDLRLYHPEDDNRPALDVRSRPARFTVSSVVRPPSVSVHRRSFFARSYYSGGFRGFQVPVGIKFRSMFPVVTCLRRKMRRAVMFALGKTRKGSRGGRRDRNWRSDVKC